MSLDSANEICREWNFLGSCPAGNSGEEFKEIIFHSFWMILDFSTGAELFWEFFLGGIIFFLWFQLKMERFQVVVVYLWWCGGVFVVVWWCFCGGVVAFLW